MINQIPISKSYRVYFHDLYKSLIGRRNDTKEFHSQIVNVHLNVNVTILVIRFSFDKINRFIVSDLSHFYQCFFQEYLLNIFKFVQVNTFDIRTTFGAVTRIKIAKPCFLQVLQCTNEKAFLNFEKILSHQGLHFKIIQIKAIFTQGVFKERK